MAHIPEEAKEREKRRELIMSLVKNDSEWEGNPKKDLMIKDWTLRTEKTEKVIVVSATSKIEIKSEVSYEKWQTRVYVSRFKCLPMVSLVQARLMSTYLPILLSEDRTKLSYIDRNENTRVFQIEWRYWRVSGCWQFYLTEFNKESFHHWKILMTNDCQTL